MIIIQLIPIRCVYIRMLVDWEIKNTFFIKEPTYNILTCVHDYRVYCSKVEMFFCFIYDRSCQYSACMGCIWISMFSHIHPIHENSALIQPLLQLFYEVLGCSAMNSMNLRIKTSQKVSYDFLQFSVWSLANDVFLSNCGQKVLLCGSVKWMHILIFL